jgi:hypothetical protein
MFRRLSSVAKSPVARVNRAAKGASFKYPGRVPLHGSGNGSVSLSNS